MLPLLHVCAAVLPVHYQFKGRDESTVFNRSQLMQLTIAALPRGSDVMWWVLMRCSEACMWLGRAVSASLRLASI